MNDETNTEHEQTDEDVLTHDVSDEALEAAAGPTSGPSVFTVGRSTHASCCTCWLA